MVTMRLLMDDKTLERFEAKVDRDAVGGCWEWTASRNHGGYGSFGVGPKCKSALAHRVAFMHWVGPIEDGREIDHLCKNPACVNPEHLEAVTSHENRRRSDPGMYLSIRARCSNGHKFTPENTFRRIGNARGCKECTRASNRKYRARRAAAVLVVGLAVLPGCATLVKLNDQISVETFGADFDNLCIVGKIKTDSAATLNEHQDTWKQHGDYTDHRQPTPVKKNDRLFNGDCSEVTKALGEGRYQDALDALKAVADGGE